MDILNWRVIEEKVFKILMVLSLVIVIGSLGIIIFVVLINGAPALSLDIITQTSSGEYYLGKPGGILNAIIGSILLSIPATFIAFIIGLCVSLYLQREFTNRRLANFIRFVLDVLWGVPSIIYGVFCFVLMILLGLSASLLAGIFALTLLEIPIVTRYMDESIKMVPIGLKESAYSLGSTKVETSFKIIVKQAFPGILAGTLLGLGRGIGDAASILFTAGFSNEIPNSIYDPTAALPTMIFQLYSSPLPVVRERAYAAAFILVIIVFIISIVSRLLMREFKKHVIK